MKATTEEIENDIWTLDIEIMQNGQERLIFTVFLQLTIANGSGFDSKKETK